MKGLDLSFSQPTQAWWNKRYAEGYRVMVQDAWTGVISSAPMLINLNRARTAGFITAAYVVVNQLPGATSVGWARNACGAEWDYLNFVAVDVEVSTTVEAVRGALAEIRRLGKKPCIYSSKHSWGVVGNTTLFKTEWLWNAYYDGDPDFDFFLNPYGGFTKLAGEQYQGTTNFDGYSVDMNNFSAAFIEEGQPMAMTDAEFLAALQRILRDPVKAASLGLDNTLIGRSNLKDYIAAVADSKVKAHAAVTVTVGLKRGDTVTLT